MKRTEIRKTRAVPPTARLLVSVGDRVNPDTPIARVETLPGKLWRVNVSRALGIDAGDIRPFVLKSPGQTVVQGEVIAAACDYFEPRSVTAPVSGVMALVSKHLGNVYIRESVELGEATGPVTVEVGKRLGVHPRQAKDFLNRGVEAGRFVMKGEILASIQWGPKPRTVESPIFGKIREISLKTGTITIEPGFKSLEIHAYLEGTVTRIGPEEVEITGVATLLNGVWGLGGEAHGILHVMEGDLEVRDSLPKGAVVVASGTASYEALDLCRKRGVAGVILGYLGSETLLRFAGPELNMGITGGENVPFPVILMEGFLPANMKPETFETFAEFHGTTVSLNGTTHIRAGVIRPEVILFGKP